MSLVGPDSAANNPSKNTGGSSPKPKLKQPKPKPAAPKKQSFADKISGGIKSLASKLNVTGPPTAAAKAAQKAFMENVGKSDDGPSGIAALKNTTDAQAQADQYAENLRRYEEYMKSQQPKGPEITPEMRQAALQTFESQRGAGQMPYYMAAANSQAPDMSPAFQYAAQNYATLGGSQRLGPRPMEMMSVAERRQINDMAQSMADQAAQQQAAQNQYQQGMDMVMRGGGKGGPRTGSQLPPEMIGMPNTPGSGGGMPKPPLPFAYGGGQPSPFASMLAQRFGGFGG